MVFGVALVCIAVALQSQPTVRTASVRRLVSTGRVVDQAEELACRWCGEAFSSRNALFRHVRTSCPATPVEALPEKRWLVAGIAYEGGHADGAAAEDAISEYAGVRATRATAAKNRAESLAEEPGLAACGDVVSVSWPNNASLYELETRLARQSIRLLWTSTAKRTFHAERCAERAYHYLLPLDWLEGWRDDEPGFFDERREPGGKYGVERRQHATRNQGSSQARQVLRSLKAVLRAAEDAFRQGHSWHNFATTTRSVSANASPMTSALDRCRVADLVRDAQGRPHAVVELRAQHFVQAQVRRMIAAAVAIQRGLLPSDFWATVARMDVVADLDDLVAPKGRLYFAGARYMARHPRQPRKRGLRAASALFSVDAPQADAATELRSQLLGRHSEMEDDTFLTVDLPRAAAKAATGLVEEDVIVSSSTQTDAPTEYREVLALLRAAWGSSDVPRTSMARRAVIRGGAGDSFTLANPATNQGKLPLANRRFPELATAVFGLERRLRGHASKSCAVNRCAQFLPHVDSGTGAGQSTSCIVGLGDYEGGALVVEGESVDVRYKPHDFDGWTQRHWTAPFRGERYSLVWFTAVTTDKKAEVREAASRLDLTYRPQSTDIEAIHEVLVRECYKPTSEWSPRGHVVLDGGGHIGCFARFALDAGARSVKAYEPEASNVALLRENAPDAKIFEAALTRDAAPARTLVLGPRRARDDAQNTWRHALSDVTHYKSAVLETQEVRCLSFFEDALDDDVTFVKLDIEGCELAILDGFAPGAWRNVQRLIFEYSFTKRRGLAEFHAIVANLRREGFRVNYDFQGSLLEDLDEWPGHSDALVFCAR